MGFGFVELSKGARTSSCAEVSRILASGISFIVSKWEVSSKLGVERKASGIEERRIQDPESG